MTYYNQQGSVHSWMSKSNYVAPTIWYCDSCAETGIPLAPKDPFNPGMDGRRHWETTFKWAAHYGGEAKCATCRKPV